ncbi:CotH kinase family protein [Epilithonimonas zeae]|uniref:Por secretion system C-terminal sorting domain-containing protein n=1 Tax=Epilithonimonas zeae TaxID=1416779 RepID=A0A1N6J6P6_9FLAO|nr:CotH kinase family protein [Epilithonimonas zeae]SIO40068.1 Por secretion system C-terminal sorting domain-containing protein [Epilithonimonas zeae]
MNKLITLFLILLSTFSYASTIELPKDSYRIDEEKKLIVCNTDLSKLEFDGQAITININGNDFKVLDNVAVLKIGIRYTINWEFNRYSIYFTNLPLLHIDTTFDIVDTPKVLSTIQLIENNGTITQSNAGIEYRGDTSQLYPKKSYEFEFWNDNTGDDTTDISLLGMREDKDWNLQAMYNEPLKIASKSAWDIWNNISQLYYKDKEPDGKTGISINYVEVFINNKYQGLYALSEKIDRKQLKLKKNTADEIRGELYKGSQWEANTIYQGLDAFDNNSEIWGGYEHKYPKDLRDWSSFYNLHDFVINSTSDDFYNHYNEKYDSQNLIDYFVFINLIRASDNMGKNLYTARYNKNEKYFFIPWDLDAVFGRAYESSISNITDDLMSNGLFNRLYNDTRTDGFRLDLKNRWTELRSSSFTVDKIMQILIDNFNQLKDNGALERDQIANSGSTISSEYEEFAYIREWLTKRIEYLDKIFDFGSNGTPPIVEQEKQNSKFVLYPNPAKNYIYFVDKNNKTEKSFLDITIYSKAGRIVKTINQNPIDQSVFIGSLSDGNYILNIKTDSGYKQSFKFIIDK